MTEEACERRVGLADAQRSGQAGDLDIGVEQVEGGACIGRRIELDLRIAAQRSPSGLCADVQLGYETAQAGMTRRRTGEDARIEAQIAAYGKTATRAGNMQEARAVGAARGG